MEEREEGEGTWKAAVILFRYSKSEAACVCCKETKLAEGTRGAVVMNVVMNRESKKQTNRERTEGFHGLQLQLTVGGQNELFHERQRHPPLPALLLLSLLLHGQRGQGADVVVVEVEGGEVREDGASFPLFFRALLEEAVDGFDAVEGKDQLSKTGQHSEREKER